MRCCRQRNDIRYIDMNIVGTASKNLSDLLAQASEVGGENQRRVFYRLIRIFHQTLYHF